MLPQVASWILLGTGFLAALTPGVSATLLARAQAQAPPASAEQIALGERLFFDRRLSSDNTISCASCHVPSLGFVDHQVTSDGVGGQVGQRNTPTVLGALFQESQFWDGRVASLEEQAKLPILNPIEMGQKDGNAVVAKLKQTASYADDFDRLYGGLTFDNVAHAIAAFERTQLGGDAPFDQFVAGHNDALSPAEQRGWSLFNGKGRCGSCHTYNKTSPLFSDQQYHNIGIAAHKQNFAKLAAEAQDVIMRANAEEIDALALQSSYSELGRYMVSKQHHDIGAFKTQTLRNIGITAPYMHDGSLPTLWDVIDHYNRGGVANAYLDGGIQRLGLGEDEIDDLVAFLFTLTDARYKHLNAAEFKNQKAAKQKFRPQRDTAQAMGQKGDYGDVGVVARHKDPARVGAL